MGITPGKIAAGSPLRSSGRAGGFIGPGSRARPDRQGRAGGFLGRGNESGAAARPTDVNDLAGEIIGDAITVLDWIPDVTTTAEPTYAETLEAYPSPVGGGEFLFSGMDPINANDCDRWPDSPFCGGSVMDPGGIGLYGPELASISIAVEVSPTETLIRIDPTIFGVNLPPVTIGFRSEGARDAVDDYWRRTRIPTITPGASVSYGNPGSRIRWALFFDNYQVRSQIRLNDFADNPGWFHEIAGHENVVFSHIPPNHPDRQSGYTRRRWAYRELTTEDGINSLNQWRAENPGEIPPLFSSGLGFGVWEGQISISHSLSNTTPPPGFNHNPDFPPYGEWWLRTIRYRPNGTIFSDVSGSGRQGVYTVGFAAIPLNPPPPPPGPPALPPMSPAAQDEPMACDCKKLEEMLKKILKTLGADDLPWNLPSNLGSGEGGQQTITNYAQLQIYNLTQLSHMLGQTEIEIKIKDSNLTEEGDQELTLKFANMSEALAEIAGLAISNQSINNATLKAAMTAVAQAGMAATSAATANQHAEEIQDFLGYEVKRDVFEMPLAYTPGETAPDKMLQPSLAKLSYWNNTDRSNLQTHIQTMEFAAALIRAAFYERIGDEVVGPGLIREKIRQAGASGGSDFDTFLERVEQGYADATGNTETTPYGRPFDERPRIRKIGNQGEDDGSNA